MKTWVDPTTSTTLSYVYDALGNRIEKNINGVKTFEYVNDNSGDLSRVLVSKNVTNNNKTHYVYGQGVLSQGGDSVTSRQYYLSDGVGNTRYVTDSAGSTIQAYTYDPYGNEVTTGNLSNFTFQGQEKDRESNLTYLRARYYDPSTGSFISKDPVAGRLSDPRSQHGYSYAHNDPVNLSDPSGELVPLVLGGLALGWAALETGWSAWSLYDNASNCEWGWAVVDGASLLIPGMPGGINQVGKVGNIIFKTEHVLPHLKKTDISQEVIERSIRNDLKSKGMVDQYIRRDLKINGQLFEYRAYRLPDGTVSVGTYFTK